MFGWDFENSKSDRVKLFLFLLVLFLVIGFSVSAIFRTINKDKGPIGQHPIYKVPKNQNNSQSAPSLHKDFNSAINGTNNFDQTEKFSNEELEATKKIAVQFVTTYHPYNAEKPQEYLENAKPYMTDDLYQKMKRNGRREVLERSYLTVKNTQVTSVVNNSSMIVRWNVIVTGEAKSLDGKISPTEDWYLVSVFKVDGDWKVEDVRVNVSE
jgi:ABC-type amino acid transport substrate-binding protein